LLLDFRSGFGRALGKSDGRLPCRCTGFFLIRLGREGEPLLAVLLVPATIAQHEPDAGQLEVGEPAQRVLLIRAKLDAADHDAALRPPARARLSMYCLSPAEIFGSPSLMRVFRGR